MQHSTRSLSAAVRVPVCHWPTSWVTSQSPKEEESWWFLHGAPMVGAARSFQQKEVQVIVIHTEGPRAVPHLAGVEGLRTFAIAKAAGGV
mmetsp:Transcript_83946/g.151481  ORF Transcript_83946/g.151481 Transcript_83946/m.151481 type:complete len:90 (-) Transcript_83946:697-966(-)